MAASMPPRTGNMKCEGALVAIARRYRALDASGLSNRLGIGISRRQQMAL